MRKWKEYKLGEVATFITDKVPTKSISIGDYISTENMIADKSGITTASNIPEIGTITKYNRGNVLVSNIRPYFKKIWFANKSGGCSNDVLCFKGNEKLLNNKYLYFLLSQDEFFDYVMLGSKGCKMPRGDKSHIMNWNILLPTITDQESITEILSSLDDKINLLNSQNRTLESMAEALFSHYFIDNAKEEWAEIELGSVVNTMSGGTPSRTNMNYYQNGKINWVKSKELSGKFILSTEETITEDALSKSSAKMIPANSILIAMYGATVGEYGIIPTEMTCNQAICALVPNADYPYTYLFMAVKSNKEKLINMAVGSAQQNISQVLIKQVPVLNCVHEIKRYNFIAESYFEKMRSNQIQIITLTKLRDTLLPKLMSGEVII